MRSLKVSWVRDLTFAKTTRHSVNSSEELERTELNWNHMPSPQ